MCVDVSDEHCTGYGKGCTNGNTCDTKEQKCVCRSDENKACSLWCTQDDGCVDLKTNPKHCGAEGTACDVSKAEMCVEGVCLDKCPSDYEKCGDMCINTETDPNNCGGCGVACPAPGENNVSRSYCQAGECKIVCAPTYFDADEDITNGCEKQVKSECGNGIVEEGEACDGSKLNDQTCETLVGEGSRGTLYCKSDCRSFDTNECTAATKFAMAWISAVRRARRSSVWVRRGTWVAKPTARTSTRASVRRRRRVAMKSWTRVKIAMGS